MMWCPHHGHQANSTTYHGCNTIQQMLHSLCLCVMRTNHAWGRVHFLYYRKSNIKSQENHIKNLLEQFLKMCYNNEISLCHAMFWNYTKLHHPYRNIKMHS